MEGMRGMSGIYMEDMSGMDGVADILEGVSKVMRQMQEMHMGSTGSGHLAMAGTSSAAQGVGGGSPQRTGAIRLCRDRRSGQCPEIRPEYRLVEG